MDNNDQLIVSFSTADNAITLAVLVWPLRRDEAISMAKAKLLDIGVDADALGLRFNSISTAPERG